MKNCLLKNIWLLLVLLCTGLCAQESDTLHTRRLFFLSDNKKQTPLDSLIDRMVTPFMQTPQNVGISIGVLSNGTSYFYNYGETQRDTRQLPSRATVYEIGSMSATFCGMLLAQAVAEHKVKLNDDIRLYLPEKYPNLVFDREPILLKHLASHTSGLPANPDNIREQHDFDSLNPYKNYTAKQVYDYLRITHLSSSPGDVFDYSNLGLAVLGLILENVYHQPFEELVKEKICKPYQMNNTLVRTETLPARQLASGYNYLGQDTPAWELGAFAAAGALHSTTADLISYLNFNLQEKDHAVKLAHTPVFTGRQMAGLGWLIKRTAQGNTLWWHNGATYGFGSFCGALKEKNSGVVILCNSATSVDYIGIAILNYLQK